MTSDDSRPTPNRASDTEFGSDAGPDPGPDVGSTFDSPVDTEVDESKPPYITVRNGDDADRTVSVSVTQPDGSLAVGDYRLASGRARAVALGDSLEGVLEIDVDAGTGGAACVSFDSSRAGDTVPDFSVRGDRVSVSGLSHPSERTCEPGGEGDDART